MGGPAAVVLRLSRQSHCCRTNTRLDRGGSRYNTTTKGQTPYPPSSSTSCGQDRSLRSVLLSLHNDRTISTYLAERMTLHSATKLVTTTLSIPGNIDSMTTVTGQLSMVDLNRLKASPQRLRRSLVSRSYGFSRKQDALEIKPE
jgi:hypothetical protein